MPAPATVVQPVSVRPLWQKDELFREPSYDPTVPWALEDEEGDDDPPTGAR